MSEVTSIKVDGEPMDIYLDRPAAGAPWPAIVLTYHREGIDDFTKWVARQYAQAGYLVAVPEVSHRIPAEVPLHDRKQHLRDPQIVADIAATVAYLKTRPDVVADRLAIAGHCMGGHILFVAACALPDFAWRGRLLPDRHVRDLGRDRDTVRAARPAQLSGDRLLRQRRPQSLAAGCRQARCRAHAPRHRAHVPPLPRRRATASSVPPSRSRRSGRRRRIRGRRRLRFWRRGWRSGPAHLSAAALCEFLAPRAGRGPHGRRKTELGPVRGRFHKLRHRGKAPSSRPSP